MGLASEVLRAVASHLRTAWWGVVAPRIEAEPLVVIQAVILRGPDDAPEVLLSVRDDLRGWELPGGNLEPGEEEAAALIREVWEETGLSIRVDRHVGDYVRSGFRPHTARVHVCAAVGGELRPSLETPLVRWFAASRPPQTLLPWYRAPLRDALARRSQPVVRHERQGLRAILAGMRIDLRMRLSGNRAGLEP